MKALYKHIWALHNPETRQFWYASVGNIVAGPRGRNDETVVQGVLHYGGGGVIKNNNKKINP